ncbi:hypothetical protein ACIA5D_33270 [Actinoplanes sp. NPDC051513]|uniref:hypothetical protein n=1 Tax=Actinoplanes sp. NPDC051513 TaxID=3363908 RepID=UPI0037A32DE4
MKERGKTFLGQPRALANLFGVELWERFSFYGMQGILLINLYYEASRGGLGIDQDTATSIVGAYGGSVYLATVIGAWFADRRGQWHDAISGALPLQPRRRGFTAGEFPDTGSNDG